MLVSHKPLDWFGWNLVSRGTFGCLFQISSLISVLKAFKISFQGNIWNENFRKSRVLPDKLVAMVIPDNLGNHRRVNILTEDSSRIKNKEGGLYFWHRTTLVVKRRSMIISEVNKRKKVSCVFKIFLKTIWHCFFEPSVIITLLLLLRWSWNWTQVSSLMYSTQW